MADEAIRNYHLQKLKLEDGADTPIRTLARKAKERDWNKKGGISFLSAIDLENLKEEILQVANSCKMQRKCSNRDALIACYDFAGPFVVKKPTIIIPLESNGPVMLDPSEETLEIGWAMYLEHDVQVASGTTILVLRLHSTD